MLSNNLLVFPTNRSVREYISHQKSTNQLLPKTITIGEFFSRLILPPPSKTFVDKDLRVLYLKSAVEQIDIKRLGLSQRFDMLYSQSDFIFKFFNELNNEFKTIDDLDTHDTYGFYSEHLDILREIYQKYIITLESNNLCDSITLPLDYVINNDFLFEFDNIILFYEGYFSSFEFHIIKKVSEIIPLKLQCTINKFNKKNTELFKNIGFVLEEGFEYTLDISQKKIISKKNLTINTKQHKIYETKNRLAQIGMAKYSIYEMIQNGIDPSSIVLVLPDEKFAKYISFFDDENYFNFAMGNDIANSSVYKISNAVNDYLSIDEPKHEKRIEYFDIDKVYLNKTFAPKWYKKLNRDSFFELFDFVSKKETNIEIKKQLFELSVLLENLLFSKDINAQLTLKDGFKIFLSKLNKISLDDVKSGKVTVMGILETRHIKYDGVIIIDFNDNIIPKRNVKDKFISSAVKRFANLPTSNDRENLQKYYYKKIIDSAKDVRISYVSNKDNIISRFINELFENPNILKCDFSNIIEKSIDRKQNRLNITQEIDLSTLEWSATSLKVFLDCKRKYYLRYILKLEEHEFSLKPKNYELGNIIHNILERNYRDKKYSYHEMINEISKHQNANPYLTLELELWKTKIKQFFNNEKARFEDGVEVYDLEKNFRIVHNGVVLKGKIDRIDKLKNGTFSILDYKTSSNLKIDTDKTIENATDFQLEFYFLATKDLGISQVAYYDLSDGKIKDELVLEAKLQRLSEILNTFATKNVEFSMCEKDKTCEFCPYKVICGKQ